MSRKTLTLFVVLFALVAAAGLTLATSAAVEDPSGSSWLSRLHTRVAALHGSHGGHGGGLHRGHDAGHGFGGGFHAVHEVASHLDLDERQLEILAEIHEAMQRVHREHLVTDEGGRAELHERLISGNLTVAEVEGLLDGHLHALEEIAEAVAPPLTDLINSLDDEQREVIQRHFHRHLQARGGDRG